MIFYCPFSLCAISSSHCRTHHLPEFPARHATSQFFFTRWFFSPVLGYYRESGSPRDTRHLETRPSFVDPLSGASTPFPSVLQRDSDGQPTSAAVTAATLRVSLIVPAYNEEERLPIMMDETLAYLAYAFFSPMDGRPRPV
jgi:hypothetical protein